MRRQQPKALSTKRNETGQNVPHPLDSYSEQPVVQTIDIKTFEKKF